MLRQPGRAVRENALENGKAVFYNKNGEIESTGNFQDGMEHGYWQWFYEGSE
jgi:antitoxin component YwqK of YwqJK toxin-antitoxin module